ncbi:MAG: hypothetical protein L0212_00775 [Acidobacteria bacterium]|nr:hypothetical protein [Acidobacteriota bacterium]
MICGFIFVAGVVAGVLVYRWVLRERLKFQLDAIAELGFLRMREGISLLQLAESWLGDTTVTVDRCAEELREWVTELAADCDKAEQEERAGKVHSLGPLYDTAINAARQELRKLIGVSQR